MYACPGSLDRCRRSWQRSDGGDEPCSDGRTVITAEVGLDDLYDNCEGDPSKSLWPRGAAPAGQADPRKQEWKTNSPWEQQHQWELPDQGNSAGSSSGMFTAKPRSLGAAPPPAPPGLDPTLCFVPPGASAPVTVESKPASACVLVKEPRPHFLSKTPVTQGAPPPASSSPQQDSPSTAPADHEEPSMANYLRVNGTVPITVEKIWCVIHTDDEDIHGGLSRSACDDMMWLFS